MVRVAAPVAPVPQEIAGLYVLVDSSASRALGYATQVRRLGELIAGLRDGPAATPLGVAAFDQEVVPIFEGTAAGSARRRCSASATAGPWAPPISGSALGWLGERLARNGRKYPRVLLVTDGVATAGETEAGRSRRPSTASATRGSNGSTCSPSAACATRRRCAS